MRDYIDLLDKVTALQNLLLVEATGGSSDAGEYILLRKELLENGIVGTLLPRFVRTSRDLVEFWPFIKDKLPSYAERRQFIRAEFRAALEAAERGASPLEDAASEALLKFDSEGVHAVWRRALDRRVQDPEGAITLARTLLETVCKHVLDDAKQAYPDDGDISKLYRLVSEQLQLAPSQYSEDAFKRILGGCTSVVEGLATLRNRLGDAHGSGPRQTRPGPRHAELAVNLAGTMATFIIATWEARKESV